MTKELKRLIEEALTFIQQDADEIKNDFSIAKAKIECIKTHISVMEKEIDFEEIEITQQVSV